MEKDMVECEKQDRGHETVTIEVSDGEHGNSEDRSMLKEVQGSEKQGVYDSLEHEDETGGVVKCRERNQDNSPSTLKRLKESLRRDKYRSKYSEKRYYKQKGVERMNTNQDVLRTSDRKQRFNLGNYENMQNSVQKTLPVL